MFKHLFCNYSSRSALSMVVSLIHCIANGTALEAIRQGVTQTAYYNTLASFDLTNSSVDAKRIEKIHFDATRTDGRGTSYLSHWSAQSDLHDPNVVTESFQLLKRSGGVTFQAACVKTKTWHNVYHCAMFSDRMDWVNCLLSEPALNQGWNLVSNQHQETPLLATLIRNQSPSCEEMGVCIVPVMNDEAINTSNKYGHTLLYLAMCRPFVCLLETLLMRPGLNMNPVHKVRSAVDSFFPPNRKSIVDVFDAVARRFAVVPLLIQESVNSRWKITLPLPLCTIIYHYYRMPYPICECDPPIAAAAPNKHSPFCFCFPPL